MAEARPWLQALQVRQTIEGEGAEAHDHPHVLEKTQLAREVGQAGVALLGRRSILRRSAADAGGDVGAVQVQTIVSAHAGGLIGEASAVQGAEEPVAGAVTGENAAGTVTAVCCRRQSDDGPSG